MEPLANKIRPIDLNGFVGQQHLVGKGKPLRQAIENRHLFSFIFWGPPGVGKTTLARIYANAVNADFFELSAVSAGKDDIRKIVEGRTLSDKLSLGNITSIKDIPSGLPKHRILPEKTPIINQKPKILFLDEIHRFNKAQQDFLLPFVESGKLTLIGATTENPSFEVIAPLLSRCRVFVMNELNDEEMSQIIDRAVQKLLPTSSLKKEEERKNPPSFLKRGEGELMPTDAKNWLVNMANGDARQAITMIENCFLLYGPITIDNLKNTLQSKTLRYDKAGEEHYNTISAFIKSMRASQADAAIYYLARMVEAGEDPKFIARRMVIFASEDIGLAQPTALVVANDVFRACETIGYPECAINLAHGVAYLANCKKDRSAYDALRTAQEDVKKYGNLPVPLKLRNASTKLMKELGYGRSRSSPLMGEDTGGGKKTNDDYLPDQLKGKKYFNNY